MQTALSIQEALEKKSGQVKIHGWVYRERKQKDLVFLIIRDHSNIIQTVVKKENVSEKEWESANKILVESSVELEGDIKEDKRAVTDYEVQVKKLNVIGFADIFPIKKDQSEELLLDNRHLWLRSRKLTAILKIRSTVFGAIHEYFRKNNFFEHQSPSFTPNACEGGSTLFKVDYFGKPMYLTQSWQLYAEAVIFALEKIYCIAPSFRAERSKTSRHLTEYWHAEVEAAWLHFADLMNLAEELIKHIVKTVLEKNKEELKILERDIEKLKPCLEKKFPRITYDEALKLLAEKQNMKVKWGKDLRTIEEEKLVNLFDTPIFVTHYPKEIKAFYMLEDPKNPKVVLGFDCLAPEGYGEIIGGSERESSSEKIIERLKQQGEKPENYSWYLELRKFGSVPHSGFGMGVERVIAWICKLENIKDAIAFPRTMVRYTP
ncbi:MAG: asparagine--tRNA ligase [Nanoarchaeota archaeon]